MKNKIYFWKRNKATFFYFTTAIILSIIYGFWDWQSWLFTPLFIAVFMAFGSRWNKAYVHTLNQRNG